MERRAHAESRCYATLRDVTRRYAESRRYETLRRIETLRAHVTAYVAEGQLARCMWQGYGLAGCRIGYALGAPEIISAFDKIRNHFGIGRVSQAGALASLADQAYLQEVRSCKQESREAPAYMFSHRS